jgi:bifunctional DNA-binding transcriptional regulator/antitoxin component of YhaV-PrlF toxin-antitoxin module
LSQEPEEEGEITTIVPATTVSKSLRSTIPSSIVRHFGLSKGDKLRWKLKAQDSKLVIVVEPIKQAKPEKKR